MKLHICSILACLTLLALAACHDDFNMDSLKGDYQNQLVLCCIPTTDQGIRIELSSTIPVKGTALPVRDAELRCTVNGQPCIATPIDTLAEVGNPYCVKYVYQCEENCKPGDKVDVSALATGFAEAHASTTLPDTVPLLSHSTLQTVSDGNEYTQVRIAFKDNPSTQDYYAVRIEGMDERGYYDRESQWIHLGWRSMGWWWIDPTGEPVLNNYNLGDGAFGNEIDYYQNFYIFDDTSFGNSGTYTLHLNTQRADGYRVKLYHISAALYHYLRRINEDDNDDMAQNGLAFVRPSFSNVSGGLGVMGGWACSTSEVIIRTQ